MDLRNIKIAELVPAASNPRKALKPDDKEYKKIKNSVSEFGYVDPVIVNKDMTVIANVKHFFTSWGQNHLTAHRSSEDTRE